MRNKACGFVFGCAGGALWVSRPTLSSLLNGKAGLSDEMALRIEKAFGVKMDTRISSVRCFGLFLRPERRLNGAGSLVPEVGDHPGPIDDAALSSRQLLLRFLEFAFGVAHTPAPDAVELRICWHANDASNLNPPHTERLSGRHQPIRVLALAEHKAAVNDEPLRDR